jgi:uncharacterized protein (TIGR02145 family)
MTKRYISPSTFCRLHFAFCTLFFAFLCFLLLILNSCKKFEREAKVITGTVSNITTTSANATGDIIDLGNGITDHGHCYGLSANPNISGSKVPLGNMGETGSFTSVLPNLVAGSTYHVRAYVIDKKDGVLYGADLSFTTSQVLVATLTTTSVTSIALTTAVSGGNISADGGGAITARGICWATTANPTITNSKTTDGSGTGSFASNLTGLLQGTTYHVRAYATNSAGTAYGNDITFTTSPVVVATLTTTAAASITLTTAISGGNITAEGGGAISARGVCWATTTAPTISGSKTVDGTGTGTFTSNLSGLQPGTTYYARAYATNSAGTAYGNDVSFTTSTIGAATLTTKAVTSITQTTAVSGGDIYADGGGTITARGVCWATTANPTIINDKTSDGTGTGSFPSNLTGLQPGTTYHVRAYATNSAGTAYGSDIPFTTNPVVVATLTTTGVTAIGLTSAVSGGNITADGGGTITARGVCWATTANPTIINDKTSDGTGTGSFPSNLTGLQPGTTYHVRAYATNSAGTAYGNQYSFNTKIDDVDGNTYNSVTIGSQVWMVENLKTTRFNNGTSIPLVTDNNAWAALVTPGYCWYDNVLANKDKYGALYNWYAVDATSNGGKNICPTGWHVPNDAQWTILTDYLTNNGYGYGGSGANIAKSIAAKNGWTASSIQGTPGNDQISNNTSGFTAIAVGDRSAIGIFYVIGNDATWWSSEYNLNNAWFRSMSYNQSNVYRSYYDKPNGFSVRCLRD